MEMFTMFIAMEKRTVPYHGERATEAIWISNKDMADTTTPDEKSDDPWRDKHLESRNVSIAATIHGIQE